VNEDEYAPAGEEEAEMHRHRRRWRPNQGDQEFNESEGRFAPAGMERESRQRTGRWVRHRRGIVLLDV
jgi:hypothetical protein